MRSSPPPDVVTFGETMGLFIQRPDSPTDYELSYAGAESNLAVAMARLGHTVRWLSRLGDDSVGSMIAERLRTEGVEVVAELDPVRSTGLMLKEIDHGITRVRYYRSDSAFAHLREPVAADHLSGAAWLHLTGITLALSGKCREAAFTLAVDAREQGVKVSVDVNVRKSLWGEENAAREWILKLVRMADLVFVGEDEAAFLTGDTSAAAFADNARVRADCPVVLKLEGGAEYSHDGQPSIVEPALGSRVVDTTGAGDAFAAGFLSGMIRGAPVRASLRLGQLLASRVLTVPTDIGMPTAPTDVARTLSLPTKEGM